MKSIAVSEVERFAFRPGLAERARYYAIVFLNQLPLSHHPAGGATPHPSFCIDETWAMGFAACAAFVLNPAVLGSII